MSIEKQISHSEGQDVSYKVGDKVLVVGNTYSHSFTIGGTVTIVRDYGRYRWECVEEDGILQVLHVNDFKLVEDKKNVCGIPSAPVKHESPVYTSKEYPPWPDTLIRDALGYISTTNTFNFKQQEEVNMSNTRRTVTIELIDDDKGLPVEQALVTSFENILIETDVESAIRELLMTQNVAASLEEHNKVRSATVNLELQNRTGATVNLRPVKLNQLRWNVK